MSVDRDGCLRIEVLRSSGLYRKIEGWASAAMTPQSETNYFLEPDKLLPGEESNLGRRDQNP